MATCNPQTLLSDASCFACYLGTGLLSIIELQLLCEINAAITGGGTVGVNQLSQGAGAPAAPPANTAVVNAYVDTDTGTVYWWNPNTAAWA